MNYMTAGEILALGFDNVAPIHPDQMVFRKEVREMCETNRCRNYNKSWSCPPACGTLEEISARAKSFPYGFLVQTTGKMEDNFDYETMQSAAVRHQENLDRLIAAMRERCQEMLPMGAGGCRRCEQCTYPDAPCRFPDLLYSSMEAYGLLVSDECTRCGAKYYYGPLTITYTGCILYR